MPRDIPVGNGQMLVTYDGYYQIRDVYFPHVGQENHAGGGPCRFGVWSMIPRVPGRESERRRQRLYWSNQGWQIQRHYERETLATDVTMSHEMLLCKLRCSDVVDFHRNILVRRIEIHNQHDEAREFRLFHHNNFQMYGSKVGDTAYFDPQLRSVVHYRRKRYLMTTWYIDGDQRVDEYACGTAGFANAEGTWRDAEDGTLGNNPISQGAVDSTVMLSATVEGRQSRTVYMIIGAGHSYDDLEELHRFVHRTGPQGVIERTVAYWRLWLGASNANFSAGDHAPPEPVVDLFKRSLLVVRSQIDNTGAIIAANDSDFLQYSRDTYSYLWPRDGALVAAALDDAGFPDIARSFYGLCSELINHRGYFLHKYNPDGSPASSWHPWVSLGKPQLPIQEDETALVLWALWKHYKQYRDIEFVRSLWVKMVQPAADFMVRFRDPDTKLPLPSYDLWEERWGIHAFTVAAVYGGLRAAWQFAVCFGDTKRATLYGNAATEIRDAFCKHFWSEKHKRFLRRIVPLDHDRTARFMADIFGNRTPSPDGATTFLHLTPNGDRIGNTKSGKAAKLAFEYDEVVDASNFAIYAFGLLDVNDPRVEATMADIEKRLSVKTDVGGVARYEGDSYHRVSDDTARVPGNPWFICTLWIADWHVAKAKSIGEMSRAMEIFEWVAEHALPSGCLAEQVHPHTNDPLSVSPLPWSHATVVASLLAYQRKLDLLQHPSRRRTDAEASPLPQTTSE